MSSWARARVIAGRELGAQLRSALPWVLMALVGLTLVSMNPTALIPSGGSLEPGEQLWRNSKFAVAQGFAWTSFFLYNFFAAIMAGFCVLRDEESGVSELLYATPLTSREYLVGKLGGVLTALAIVLTAHLLIAAGLSQFGPGAPSAAQNGPFRWSNFLAPALAFAVPGIWFSAGLGFAVGVRTRQPIAVFAVPTTVFLVTVYVFNAWPLTGLDRVTEQWLMILDPSGLRWLAQTVFGVDRGATFYNTAPLGLDATFWLCRILAMALPFAAVWLAARYHRRSSAGSRGRSTGIGRLWWRSASPAIANGGAAFGPLPDGGSFGSLAHLRMSSVPPARGAVWSAYFVAELREFRRQPGLYLFVVLIVAAAAEFATEPSGDGAGSIPSTGELAVGTLEVVTFLCCLLLLVLLVEALGRERRTGLDSIVDAMPVRGAEILWGKGLAAAVVVALTLLAASVTGLALLEIEAPGDLEVLPILWVWGILVSVSLLAWGAAVITVWSIVRDRAATYAIGLLALAASAGVAASGASNWLTNWTLAGALRWSDIAPFELYREALWLNRLLVLLSALTLALVAGRAYSRRELDVVARPRRRRWLTRSLLWVVPPAVAALLVACTLSWRIHDGFQGDRSRERAREYWQSNAVSWSGVESPIVTHLDLRVDLHPDRGSAAISGAYRMTNRTARTMRRVAFTTLPALDRVAVEWTVDDVRTRAQERSGLHVLHLAEEWIPGEQRRVGFAYEAKFPRGLTRNGGELEQFVLPSGVVLHTLRESFLPQPGFSQEIGGARHGVPESRAAPGPAVGPAVAFTTRLEISAPSAFVVNSVGERARETTSAGRTTVVWASDEPVRAINIVAGRWSVLRRDGAAVFHHAAHADGAREVLDALAAARVRFSEWFYPYPWKELRLNEFPNTVSNAQGFASNISFSEALGFDGATAGSVVGEAYIVTAHEAAHQWWGNLMMPADALGADVLIEGMAHYSTLLLLEFEQGEAARIDFARRLERRYLSDRRVDSEPPLIEVGGGSRAGEDSVALDKGAWALWMLDRHLGRERMLAGLRTFIARSRAAPTGAFVTLDDLVETLRPLARDPEVYDQFVEQWFYEVVTPRFIVRNAISTPVAVGGWRVTATVANAGTGKVSVEVATVGDGDSLSSPTTVTLEAGTERRIELSLAFEPRRMVVDPGVHVLQTDRARAWAPVIAASPIN